MARNGNDKGDRKEDIGRTAEEIKKIWDRRPPKEEPKFPIPKDKRPKGPKGYDN